MNRGSHHHPCDNSLQKNSQMQYRQYPQTTWRNLVKLVITNVQMHKLSHNHSSSLADKRSLNLVIDEKLNVKELQRT